MTARELINELREQAEQDFIMKKVMLLKASDVLTLTSMITLALNALDEIEALKSKSGYSKRALSLIAQDFKAQIDGIAGGKQV